MAALIAGLRHCFGYRSGNVAIEFGLVLPVVVTMLAGVIEFGLAANERTSLEVGARAGAQYALQRGLDLDGIRDAVDSASGLAVASDDITAVEFYECSGAWGVAVSAGTTCADDAHLAKFITVIANKTYSPILPFLGAVVPSELKGSATLRVP